MHAKNLLLHACNQDLYLSCEKYRDADVSAVSHDSTVIFTDMLDLPAVPTVKVAAFKHQAKAEFDAQCGPTRVKLVDLQNRASLNQFNKPLQAIIEHQKEALRRRYAAAHAVEDVDFRVAELQACARQGYVQANIDLGMLFEAQHDIGFAAYYVEAHNLGHPESLLHLWRAFSRAGDQGAAVRVLLLGASCGSVRCAEVLLQILEHRPQAFESDRRFAALEASLADGTVHARYILGFVLLHGDSRRDEARGRALIVEAGAMRHYRGDNGKGAPLVAGTNQFAAGTLAHFEKLIDLELLAIRSHERMPEFIAEVGKISSLDEKGRAALDSALLKFYPVPERLVRRTADWLANAGSEPVDPIKLERMKTLALPDDDGSKEGSHE